MSSDQKNITYCFCIGAKKAGTTWLYQCLKEHPEVHVSPIKEPHYFSHEFHNYSLQEYYKKTKSLEATKIQYESSVSYLAHHESAERIKEVLPKSKIVVILREPSDRSFSDFLHFVSKGRLSGNASLAEAIDKYPEIIENSLYGKDLERYFDQFDASDIHIIWYQDIAKQPQIVLNELCDFLSITTFTPSVLKQKIHTTSARFNPIYFSVNQLYRKCKNNFLGKIVISIFKKLGLKGVMLEKLLAFKGTKRAMTEAEKEFLSPFFISDQEKLRALVKEIKYTS